jgi:hypothetical protein
MLTISNQCTQPVDISGVGDVLEVADADERQLQAKNTEGMHAHGKLFVV